MRNNPYHKNLKDHLPLFMQGPRSISALLANEEQKILVKKAKQIPDPKKYSVRNVSFNMVSPPVLNRSGTSNPPDLLKKEMGQTEVTQDLFQAVMGWNDSNFKYSPQNPVEGVTWYDCISFCNKLSNILGLEACYNMTDIEKEIDQRTQVETKHIKKAKVTWDERKNGFRLPTENEWVLFAEAGTNNTWSGTNDVNKLDQYAWYDKNSGKKTHPVGEKLPNEWGLYDMSGNVEEWCWDWYDNPYFPEFRVLHGGFCRDLADYCRVARRNGHVADARGGSPGLRLLRSSN